MSVSTLTQSPSLLRQLAVELETKYLKAFEVVSNDVTIFVPDGSAPSNQRPATINGSVELSMTRWANMIFSTFQGAPNYHGGVLCSIGTGFTGNSFTILSDTLLPIPPKNYVSQYAYPQSITNAYFYGSLDGYVGSATWFFNSDSTWGCNVAFEAFFGSSLPAGTLILVMPPNQINYITTIIPI